MARFIDRDRGWKRIQKAFSEIGDIRCKVGVQGEEAGAEHGPGVTNADVALFNEFGTRRGVPERSFLRASFDDGRSGYERDVRESAKRLLAGEGNARGDLLRIGERYRGDVLARIKAKIAPPLAAETIRRKKGEDTPLIDTGQLWNSIRAVVTDGPVDDEGGT